MIKDTLSLAHRSAFCKCNVWKPNCEPDEIELSGGFFDYEEKYTLKTSAIHVPTRDASYAALLDASSQRYRVHLKLDTGMHRLGERCEHLDRIAAVFLCRNLSIEGVYTHLCAADADSPQSAAFTRAQGKAFYDTVATLERRGYSCGKTHLLASSGLLHYPELGGAYARVGIALYGVLGRSGAESISAYDVAEQTESITNEVLSRLGGRLERILL